MVARPQYFRIYGLLFVTIVAGGGSAAISAQQSDDLIAAARRGDLATVNALSKSGADVNDRKFTGTGSGSTTALMEASFYGHLPVVQALLGANAPVNASVSNKSDGETALILAVRKGHVEVVRALLAAHANVDHPCCEANALYEAVRANNPEMLRVLLAAKPDLNPVGRIDGRTPLMVAVDSGYWDEARLLVEAGADVNIPNKRNGFTPLLRMTSSDGPKSLEMVQMLLAAHAMPNFRDCNRSFMTPLGFASITGNVEVVRALFAANADVNLAQCDGKTPLVLASLNGQADIVRVLLPQRRM